MPDDMTPNEQIRNDGTLKMVAKFAACRGLDALFAMAGLEGIEAANGSGFISTERSKADFAADGVSGELRTLWDETSIELKVGVAALAAFGLGMYIGKRTN